MKKIAVFVLLIFSLVLAGCINQAASKGVKATAPYAKIRIAIQYGLGYAPVDIMKEKRLLEKYLPGIEVEWKQMASGGAIREAMVANQIDVAFMGIPPFLIGWDKGVEAKVACGLLSSPQGLQVNNKTLRSLADFSAQHKIALPSPGSVQHILLAMAAEKELKNPKALDANLVAMAHPDAAASLLSGKSIAAHFTSPPYLYQEVESKEIASILSSEQAFGGEHSFLVGTVTKKFHDQYPAGYAAFIAAISEAINYINTNPQETAKILAPMYKVSEARMQEFLTWKGTNYTITPYGLLGFAEFMKKSGYISKLPKSFDEIAWENVSSMIGKKQGSRSPLENAQYRQ